MKNVIFRVAVRRFFELLFTCAFISAICTALNVLRIANTNSKLSWCLIIGSIAFALVNFQMLRRCCMETVFKDIYFISNYSAYLFFAGIGYAVEKIFGSAVYAWGFGITKFLKYTYFKFSSFTSAAIFHTVMILLIFVASIGVDTLLAVENHIATEDDYEDEE